MRRRVRRGVRDGAGDGVRDGASGGVRRGALRAVGLHLAVAAGGFRRYATYGTATAAGVFTNTVFGFIVAYTYIALWDERPGLGGYDQSQALTFVG